MVYKRDRLEQQVEMREGPQISQNPGIQIRMEEMDRD